MKVGLDRFYRFYCALVVAADVLGLLVTGMLGFAPDALDFERLGPLPSAVLMPVQFIFPNGVGLGRSGLAPWLELLVQLGLSVLGGAVLVWGLRRDSRTKLAIVVTSLIVGVVTGVAGLMWAVFQIAQSPFGQVIVRSVEQPR